MGSLELSACFPSLSANELVLLATRSERIPLILGALDDGCQCSVLDAVPVQIGMSGSDPVHLVPRFVLHGCALNSRDDQFHTVHIECSHLAAWIGKHPKQDVQELSVKLEYSLKADEVLGADVAQPSGHLSIQSWLSPSYPATEFVITSHAAWAFNATSSVGLETLLSVTRHCQNFLTLVLGKPSNVLAVVVVPEAAPLGASLITSMIRSPDNKTGYPDPLLRFDQLGADGSAVLKKWFEIREDFNEVLSMMFASKYISSYTTTEFLNLVQALESFHRRKFGGRYYSETDYRSIHRSLLDATPAGLADDFQDKLKGLYEFANEYNLRKRLRELFASLSPSVRGWIRGDEGAFIQKVVRTRNYLTHLDPRSRVDSFIRGEDDLGDLWQANITLNGLATALFLQIIGVPETAISGRMFRPI